MTDYRVPKRRLPVQVTLVGGASLHVSVFLAPFASSHLGEERLDDLLNGPHDFIPAQEVGSGATTLLNRAALVVARVTHQWVTDPPGAVSDCVDERVRVLLLDGSELTGSVSYALPEANGRLSDFLNTAAPFLELQDEGGTAFVSKRHVARIAVVPR